MEGKVWSYHKVSNPFRLLVLILHIFIISFTLTFRFMPFLYSSSAFYAILWSYPVSFLYSHSEDPSYSSNLYPYSPPYADLLPFAPFQLAFLSFLSYYYWHLDRSLGLGYCLFFLRILFVLRIEGAGAIIPCQHQLWESTLLNYAISFCLFLSKICLSLLLQGFMGLIGVFQYYRQLIVLILSLLFILSNYLPPLESKPFFASFSWEYIFSYFYSFAFWASLPLPLPLPLYKYHLIHPHCN